MGKKSKRKRRNARMIFFILLIAAMIGIISNGKPFISYFQVRLLGIENPSFYASNIENPSTDGYIQIAKEQADIYKGELILVNKFIVTVQIS